MSEEKFSQVVFRKPIRAKLSPINPVANFLRCDSGGVGVIFGVAAIPLVLFMGAAVDLGRANLVGGQLQAAADAAALAAARSPGEAQSIAAATIAANLSGRMEPGAPQVQVNGDEVEVTVTYQVDTAVMKLAGMESITVTRTAAASLSTATGAGDDGAPVCMLLVNPSRWHALDTRGSSTVNASGCEIHVHSTAPVAANFAGSTTMNVADICVAGGASLSGSYSPGGWVNGRLTASNVTTQCDPAPDSIGGTLPVVDVPATLPAPVAGAAPACTHNNMSYSSGAPSFNNAVFCGTTTFGGSMSGVTLNNVTFNGPVNFGGSINLVSGNNVTFRNTLSFGGSTAGNLSNITVLGNASFGGSTLTTVDNGVFGGNVAFSGWVNQTHSNLTVHGNLTSSGSNHITISGHFKPYGDVTLSGSSQMTVPGDTTWHGKVSFSGSQTLNLGPGLHIFKDAVTFTGSSRINGTDVTLYFANKNATFTGWGSTQANLTAPETGPYANILMFEPPGLEVTYFRMMGSVNTPHRGLIYLPSREASFTGSSGMNADVLQIVFNSLKLDGSNSWRFNHHPAWVLPKTPGAGAATARLVR